LRRAAGVPDLAEDLWAGDSALRSLLDEAADRFPADGVPLLELAAALAQAGRDSLAQMVSYLDRLPSYAVPEALVPAGTAVAALDDWTLQHDWYPERRLPKLLPCAGAGADPLQSVVAVRLGELIEAHECVQSGRYPADAAPQLELPALVPCVAFVLRDVFPGARAVGIVPQCCTMVLAGEARIVMLLEEQTHWDTGAGLEFIRLIHVALSVLNRLLMLRCRASSVGPEPSLLERLLTEQPAGRSQLRPVLAIAQYLFHRHNPHLPTLAIRLLLRLAKVFPMSLLASFGQDSDVICGVILTRLPLRNGGRQPEGIGAIETEEGSKKKAEQDDEGGFLEELLIILKEHNDVRLSLHSLSIRRVDL
ncbi:uncharacterized protein LOC119095821, partial [Pollicipes pollicipes]|uniref:uncharacterized protein LOC119095821 n=1 Tax=Pollicipes pollicipes TaxID=41117 RepID=UPI0018849C99